MHQQPFRYAILYKRQGNAFKRQGNTIDRLILILVSAVNSSFEVKGRQKSLSQTKKSTKNLVVRKKSNTFAHAFEKQTTEIRQLSWQSTTLLMLGSWVRAPCGSQIKTMMLYLIGTVFFFFFRHSNSIASSNAKLCKCQRKALQVPMQSFA